MKKLSRLLSRRRPDDGDSDLEARRLRDGTGGHSPETSAVPAFHQLPPRRASGSEDVSARKRRELSRNLIAGGCVVVADDCPDVRVGEEADQAGLEADDTSGGIAGSANKPSRRPPYKICPRCAAVEFPWLLDWKPGQSRPWIQLSHVLSSPSSAPPSPSAGYHQSRRVFPPGTPQCPFCLFFRAMIGPVPADALAKFNPYLRIRQAFERLDGIGEKHELARSVLIEVTTRRMPLPWGYLLRAADGDDDGPSAYLAKKGEGVGIRGRRVPPLLDPSLPKCWLDFCRQNHCGSTCTAPTAPISGFQLIDCIKRRVIAASEIDSDRVIEYLTLSYAWAQTGLASSVGAPFHLPALRLGPDGRLPDEMPPLFADAVAFTAAIGFRYLWIDRFCLQADSAARRQQVDLMGEIYSRSSLTLIVAAEDDVLTGIAGLSTPREHQLSLRLKNAHYTTSLVRPDLEVASSKWASRAWTLQEGLLSRRRLIFTTSQVYFQCRALHCYESICLPLRLASDWKLGRVFPAGDGCPRTSGQLKDLIKTYMCRDLANNDERFDAFKGLLREYERMDSFAVENFLGLPLFHPDDFARTGVVSETDRLAAGLGWICDWNRTLETPTEPSCRRNSSFPSWTWLAWNLRRGMTVADNHFSFNLMDDTSPILRGVSAAPKMEISVGFKDDATVLSWEIDGTAISRKQKTISFLRLETYCFDLVAALDKSNAVSLQGAVTMSRSNRRIVEGIVRASLPERMPERPSGTEGSGSGPDDDDDDDDDDNTEQEFHMIGLLVSGRNWNGGAACQATALICGRNKWEKNGPWIRLGAVAMECESLSRESDEVAVMQGIKTDEDTRRDLRVRLRELDLY